MRDLNGHAPSTTTGECIDPRLEKSFNHEDYVPDEIGYGYDQERCNGKNCDLDIEYSNGVIYCTD